MRSAGSFSSFAKGVHLMLHFCSLPISLQRPTPARLSPVSLTRLQSHSSSSLERFSGVRSSPEAS